MVCYAWQFSGEQNEGGGGHSAKQIFNPKKGINVGIDKKFRAFFLRKLEFLTRQDVNCYLHIELSELPDKTPVHLDNNNEFLSHEKIGYDILEIHITKRKNSYITINEIDNSISVFFTYQDIFIFFTKMYVVFELYATLYDNIIRIGLNSNGLQMSELIIWGVYDGKPIYY